LARKGAAREKSQFARARARGAPHSAAVGGLSSNSALAPATPRDARFFSRQSIACAKAVWFIRSPKTPNSAVLTAILRSSHNDACRTYHTSSASFSAGVTNVPPLIWAHPVMPGRTTTYRRPERSKVAGFRPTVPREWRGRVSTDGVPREFSRHSYRRARDKCGIYRAGICGRAGRCAAAKTARERPRRTIRDRWRSSPEAKARQAKRTKLLRR
jgi:hypothetical protein